MQRIDQIDGVYHLDAAHSAVGFTVRHAGLTRVRGTFDAFHGYAVIDAAHVDDSALMVSISTASINTFQADRDAHLRSGDFFDVAAFPAITYVATGFEILDEAHVLVRGDLTIKDVTRALDLTFEWTGSATDPFGNERIGFETSTRISRKDYGLTWNAALETGGWLVSDEIMIDIEASAVKQAEAAAGQPAPDATLDVTTAEFSAPASAEGPTEVTADAAQMTQGDGDGTEPPSAAPARSSAEHAAEPDEDQSTGRRGARRAVEAGHSRFVEALSGEAPRPRRGMVADEDEVPRPGGWRRLLGRS